MQEMRFKCGTIAERRVTAGGLDFALLVDPDDETAIEDMLIESDPPTAAQVEAYRRGDWRFVVVTAAPVLFPEMPAHLLAPDIDPELTARLFGNWVGRWPEGDGTGGRTAEDLITQVAGEMARELREKLTDTSATIARYLA